MLLFTTGGALVWMSGCGHRDETQAHQPERPPPTVTVAPAQAGDVPVYLDEIGKTVAVETVSVIPQVGGKIIRAEVQDGDLVTKGQLLFEIDPRPFESALAAAEASLAQSQAELQWAQIEFTRAEGLISTAAASKLEFDETRVGVAVAKAKVDAAAASVETARLNLEYTKIHSPLDGRAGARLVDSGNVVAANQVPLLVIRRLDPIYAEFAVTEDDLGAVRRFMAASAHQWGDSPERELKVFVNVSGSTDRVLAALDAAATTQPAVSPATQPAVIHAGPREGKLTFLDNAVEPATGTAKLRATLDNADRRFWPGQFVNVRLVLTTRENAVLVPAMAQQVGQKGPYVYVIKPDGTAELRPITTGQRQGDLMVVEQGLEAGEQVVVVGQTSVMPGGKVLVANAKPDQPPPDALQGAAARLDPQH